MNINKYFFKKKVILLMCIFSFLLGFISQPPQIRHKQITFQSQNAMLSEWQIMIMAIIGVESEYNPKAKNGNFRGYFQLGKDYVNSVNRISKDTTFTHDDAFKPWHSFKMFDIMNSRYNPNSNINKAISIHNNMGGAAYQAKIKRRMNDIRKYEKTRYEMLNVIKE